LVKRKYSKLFSSKTQTKPGRKGPEQELIELVVEMKRRNPRFGYGRIAMQIFKEFGIDISRFAVARILRQNYKNIPDNNGPSWLTFMGHAKDSLWSADLFRCESILLKSYWVMLVIDIYSRRIIGFSIQSGNPDGITTCCMFNKIIVGKTFPKCLSSDNDPLFESHRWQANLRILGIKEIKTVLGTPTSHPFIERSIGLCRQEFLNHVPFWNAEDLARKLNHYQDYFNETRAHSSLDRKTPNQKASNDDIPNEKTLSLGNHRWKSFCHGLFNLPVVA
jgi:transposase InsO family protein